MRLLVGIILVLMIIGLAQSSQLGGTTGKVILLGGMSKNALSMPHNLLSPANTSNQTNITNETNITGQWNALVAIKNPMSTIPVSNRYKNVNSPSSIQANSIAYRFTT
jgi:hypothetical protein